ncbi:lachesin isoform X1 [Ceratitis capitata]|uniref:lachesin isoform X1 n=1 Tax=Ceratitis capitata TaxID=7213 RepID=UPI000A113134|nr:lachesin isoform X1 [Ceratitis capitata]
MKLFSNFSTLPLSKYEKMTIVLLLISLLVKETLTFQPEFVESISNVSVAVGRDATFTCHVRHLGGYRVGWLKADTKAIQAIHENVITHNPRVSVSHLDQNTWNLHIKAVSEEDRGGYMCQLNTDPMKSQIGFLDVVIPPDFVAEDTSSDVIVPEGSSVKLTCRARGYPEPIVTWRREDGNEIVLKDNIGTKTMVSSFRGEVLKLTKISRNEMGSYLCIASNGVPPSVSKRISLNIHFHPVIQVPNQLVGAPLGTDVQIECHVEASPKSINYWIKDTGEMIVSSLKYHVQESSKSMYETKMTMIVRKFQKDDVGSYRCIAKNSLGEVDSSIRLYEIPGPTRKNAAGKHGGGGGGDADTNDVLKMKQVKVTYQPDDEDLYGSAEDFDDSELPLPPLTPNIYFPNGQRQATHRPATSGAGISGGTHSTANGGGGTSDGRHHHHNNNNVAGGAGGSGVGGSAGGIGSLDFGNLGATSGSVSISGGGGGGGVVGVFAVSTFGGITRRPFYGAVSSIFGGQTEARDAMYNKETAPTEQHSRHYATLWSWWWQQQLNNCYYRWRGHWRQALHILLVSSLITSFCWNLL